MPITNYKLASGFDANDLSAKVDALIATGHAVIGDTFQRGETVFQAMGLGTYDVGTAESFHAVTGSNIESLLENVAAVLGSDMQPIGGPVTRGNSLAQFLGKVASAGGGDASSITVDPIDSAGGGLAFPGGTLQEALQAIADLADPGM